MRCRRSWCGDDPPVIELSALLHPGVYRGRKFGDMRIRIAVACLILCAPLLFAQGLKESVTVEVVDVPVYVYHPGGGPIRTLTKENFELFVNGKRQTIEYFDTVDFSAVPKPQQQQETATVARDPRERRLFLLVFDLVFTRADAITRAQKAAVAMIDRGSPSDYFAVVTFTHNNGAQFLVPFTNDHAVARHAAYTLSESPGKDPLSIAISASARKAVEGYTLADGDRTMQPTVNTLQRETADAANRMMPLKRLIENQVLDFDAIATRLAQLEGYKHVVLLSEGFSPGAVYSNPYTTDNAMVDAMKDMFSSFKRANVVIDAIDLGHPDRNSFMNDALRMMAQETGGQFVRHTNDFTAALKEISDVTAFGYHLGFTPRDARKGDNKIEVKLRNAPKGATLSFRRGFSNTPALVDSSDGLHLADILLNDIPQAGIPPKLEFRVRPFIDVDVTPEMLAEGPATVLLYVFDENRIVVEFKQQYVSNAGIVRGKLDLPSGKYMVKVLLQSGDSIGFAKRAILIP